MEGTHTKRITVSEETNYREKVTQLINSSRMFVSELHLVKRLLIGKSILN